jgi:protein N-terminal amidase
MFRFRVLRLPTSLSINYQGLHLNALEIAFLRGSLAGFASHRRCVSTLLNQYTPSLSRALKMSTSSQNPHLRIALVQNKPKLGDVQGNIARVDRLISQADLQDGLDILVLCEMVFTGYAFAKPMTHTLLPYLEPTTAGVTTEWAIKTAIKLNCHVVAGYAERSEGEKLYNSAVFVSPQGEILANYRKHHLYYVDEEWALEGEDGFWTGDVPGLGRVALGICMDLNPYQFAAAFDKYEFATHCVEKEAEIVLVPMAWNISSLTADIEDELKEDDRPEAEKREFSAFTVEYWLSRVQPFFSRKALPSSPSRSFSASVTDKITSVMGSPSSETETKDAKLSSEVERRQPNTRIVVFANRVGAERTSIYAGSSSIWSFAKSEQQDNLENYAKIFRQGIIGSGVEGVVVADIPWRSRS